MAQANGTKREPYLGWMNDQGFDTFSEQKSPIPLTISGTIPAYAAGILYRVGPGGQSLETAKGNVFSVDHWFDGFSQVHRFEIQADKDRGNTTKVLYNSRHICDSHIERIRKTGSLDGFSFGQKRDPCESYFHKLKSMFFSSTPAPDPKAKSWGNIGVTLSVNLPGLNLDESASGHENSHSRKLFGVNTLFAKTDHASVQQIHPDTLEPIGHAYQKSLHPDLNGQMSASHGKSDPDTGDFYNYNLHLGMKSTYRIFRVSAKTGETSVLATFTHPAAYIHSLFLTEQYVVLCVWNGHLAANGLGMLWSSNVVDAINPVDPARPATWFVVDKHRVGAGVLAKYESPAFFAFHSINAWQEPSPADPSVVDLVLEVLAYDSLDILKHVFYENLRSTTTTTAVGASARAHLRRYRLPSVPRRADPTPRGARLDFAAHDAAHDDAAAAFGMELPTLDPRRATRAHRFTYGVADRGRSSFFDGIVKWDGERREAVFWDRRGHTPGEPIFVADPRGTGEDEGVLLSVVLDGEKGCSYLLCLDARTLSELGRAEVDGVASFGFHGTFAPRKGENLPDF